MVEFLIVMRLKTLKCIIRLKPEAQSEGITNADEAIHPHFVLKISHYIGSTGIQMSNTNLFSGCDSGS